MPIARRFSRLSGFSRYNPPTVRAVTSTIHTPTSFSGGGSQRLRRLTHVEM